MTLDLSRHARIMGILNVTPDSFSDGGRHAGLAAAIGHARGMIAEGAEIIDIGGESTRPGAQPVAVDEELRRVVPVVVALRKEWTGLISIDTSKAAVAAAALEAGADIVNDVSGLLADPRMPAVCAAARCGVVVMHAQGEPRTMQVAPRYDDVVATVRRFFADRRDALVAAGLAQETLCFDPGIGFGKSVEHNMDLLRAIDQLSPPGRPLMLGVSRKSFLGKILHLDDPPERDVPTAALTALTRCRGVMLHRVHAVAANRLALRTAERLLGRDDHRRSSMGA